MKFKFLSLFLALSLFAFGSHVSAQGTSEQTAAPSASSGAFNNDPGDGIGDEKELADAEAEAGFNPVGALCKVLMKVGACNQCANTSDIGKCFKAIAQNPKVLSKVCYVGCNHHVCKQNDLQKVCMQNCCPNYEDKIQNCLKQNGGKSCSQREP